MPVIFSNCIPSKFLDEFFLIDDTEGTEGTDKEGEPNSYKKCTLAQRNLFYKQWVDFYKIIFSLLQ